MMVMGNEHERRFLSGKWAKKVWAVILPALLASCGGGSNPVPSFLVGGTVSGLAGSGLVLQNNGANDLSIAADGTFSSPRGWPTAARTP